MSVTTDLILEAPADFRGEWIHPTDPRYPELTDRYNARSVVRPVVIARPRVAADVRTAVRFARANDLEIEIRGGGHHSAPWSKDGGLVIDMRLMRWTRVDPETSTAWVGGGTFAADLIVEAERFGLAAVTGDQPDISIAGLCMGLGEGALTPKYGYGADNILALEMVTAAGEIISVSAGEHPDLFWAMRGAGANFGVVTAIKLRLHPLPTSVLGGAFAFDAADAPRVLADVWTLMQEGPNELYPVVVIERVQEDGKWIIRVFPHHTGLPQQADRDVAPFRSSPVLVRDETSRMTYPEMQNEHAHVGLRRLRQMWEAVRFLPTGDTAMQIDVMAIELERFFALDALSADSSLILWRDVAPPAPEAASVAPRLKGICLAILASWCDRADDGVHIDWVVTTANALRESGQAGECGNAVNNSTLVSTDRLRGLFGEENFRRLQSIKAEYDPENTFHGNYNIPPAPPEGQR